MLSFFKTYQSLIITFGLIVSLTIVFHWKFGSEYMHTFMALFFIFFSYLKLVNISKFVESFTQYDPLAQKISWYAWCYPWIEWTLGIAFLLGSKDLIFITSLLTIGILGITTYGVIQILKAKKKIQCGCLGGTLHLPLSWVTILENAVMILMALWNIALS